MLDDGGEVDLDLGNYERFLDIRLTKDNNLTTGKIYQYVINKERKGDYLGKTVQGDAKLLSWCLEMHSVFQSWLDAFVFHLHSRLCTILRLFGLCWTWIQLSSVPSDKCEQTSDQYTWGLFVSWLKWLILLLTHVITKPKGFGNIRSVPSLFNNSPQLVDVSTFTDS